MEQPVRLKITIEPPNDKEEFKSDKQLNLEGRKSNKNKMSI